MRRSNDIIIAGRETIVDIVIVLCRNTHLLQIIAALTAAGSFAGSLHGRQEKRNQDGDDGDHHQQFNERKSPAQSGSYTFTL